jgi:hypothetical protein
MLNSNFWRAFGIRNLISQSSPIASSVVFSFRIKHICDFIMKPHMWKQKILKITSHQKWRENLNKNSSSILDACRTLKLTENKRSNNNKFFDVLSKP